MKTISTTALLGALWLTLPAAAQQPAAATRPLATIGALDLPRYLGTWYEIAKYPNRFQRDCARDTTAEYTANADGSVRVVNRCRRADGSVDEAVGKARQPGGPTSPKLEVRFAPAWLSWLPAVWGDYWVIDLDAGYRLAAVGEPKREYLWILSRTPTVDARELDALIARLAAQGYDPAKLQRSRHD